MSQFIASTLHPLMAKWYALYQEPEYVWASEAQIIADRAENLVCNDSFMAALINAELAGTFGPIGLRHSSLLDLTPEAPHTSDATRAMRRNINAITNASWSGTDIDVEGTRTRLDLEWGARYMASVRGDGFLVRAPGVDGRSAWRLVHPSRVRNPIGTLNGPKARDGFALNASGRRIGMWVYPAQFTNGVWLSTFDPTYIPWCAPDGTPNVVHCRGLTIPGMMRGVSVLAPIIMMARQVQGVLQSHVAGKRVQSTYPLIVEAEDVEAYKAAVDDGTAFIPGSFEIDTPLQLWVKPPGSTVDMPDTKFNGADLKDYIHAMYRVMSAIRGMPVEVVLCQMGEASLSSARAGLDQYDRTCQGFQGRQIAECSETMDKVAVMDAWALDEIDLGTVKPSDWRRIMAAKYERPQKYSTDRLKDGQTMEVLMSPAVGMSGPTVYAMFGQNWEDEQEIKAASAQFLVAQGIAPAPAAAPAPGGPAPVPPPASGGGPPEDIAPPAGAQAATPWWKPSAWSRLFSFRRSDRAAA